MTLLYRIAELVFNRPLLVHPGKLPLLMGVLNGRIPLSDEAVKDLSGQAARAASARPFVVDDGATGQFISMGGQPDGTVRILTGPKHEASQFVGSPVDTDPVTGKRTGLPYRRTAEGVAIIPVLGALVNRGAWLGSSSGETSYEGLKFQVQSAVADPRTTAIMLDIASPGGEAVGAGEAAAVIRAARDQKRVVAVVNGMAASAAYWLAASADTIVTSESGVLGSIGVVLMHADISGALEKEGIKPTLIFAGDHKVDANPFEPLPDAVREDLQAEVMRFYGMFVDGVAAGRGGAMTVETIRATEARTFIGQDAIDQGLADRLGTFETALSQLTAEMSQPGQVIHNTATRRAAMATNDKPAAPAATFTQADLDAAVAAATEGNKGAQASAAAQAAEAQRARIAAILALPEASGREKSAHHLALNTDLSVDAAKGVLAGIEAAVAAPTVPSVAQRAQANGPIGVTVAAAQPAHPGADHGAAPWSDIGAKLNAQGKSRNPLFHVPDRG